MLGSPTVHYMYGTHVPRSSLPRALRRRRLDDRARCYSLQYTVKLYTLVTANSIAATLYSITATLYSIALRRSMTCYSISCCSATLLDSYRQTPLDSYVITAHMSRAHAHPTGHRILHLCSTMLPWHMGGMGSVVAWGMDHGACCRCLGEP